MTPENRQVLLQRRPEGPITPDVFAIADAPMPEPGEGEVLVRVLYVSVDPTQRVWISRDSYLPAVKIGAPIRAFGVGEVVASAQPSLPVGALVSGMLGWREYAALSARRLTRLPAGADPIVALSVMGHTGLTAYFGLLEIGEPQEGETVLVSGAAGATGSVAAQIAKASGCRVVGTAGSDEKCRWLVEVAGIDAAINYKTFELRDASGVRASRSLGRAVRAACPDGVDVFFDNVGGAILDVALANLALRGRVVLCGGISQYDSAAPQGPKNYLNLVSRRGRMEGFLILDYMPRAAEAMPALAGWVADGSLKNRTHVIDGLERAPEALGMLFSGANQGKLLIKVA